MFVLIIPHSFIKSIPLEYLSTNNGTYKKYIDKHLL